MRNLHPRKPYPEDRMDIVNPEHSICKVLAEIYHSTEDCDIRLKCRLATAMAKSMSSKIERINQKIIEEHKGRIL